MSSGKVSFVLEQHKLDRVHDFMGAEGMTLSEAMRFIVDAGLQVLEKAEMIKAAPLGSGATRGIFPAPTGAKNGA